MDGDVSDLPPDSRTPREIAAEWLLVEGDLPVIARYGTGELVESEPFTESSMFGTPETRMNIGVPNARGGILAYMELTKFPSGWVFTNYATCSLASVNDDDSSASGDPHLVGEHARILVDGTKDRDVMLGGQFGQLRFYAPDRCLVLETGRDGEPELDEVPKGPVIDEPPSARGASWLGIVWPYGTTVIEEGDRYGVQLADGRKILAGDLVRGAGGSWPESEDDKDDKFYGLPKDCTGGSLDQLIP